MTDTEPTEEQFEEAIDLLVDGVDAFYEWARLPIKKKSLDLAVIIRSSVAKLRREKEEARTSALREALNAVKIIRRVKPGGGVYEQAILGLLSVTTFDPGEWAAHVIEEAERRGWDAARRGYRSGNDGFEFLYDSLEDWKKSQEPK